MFKNCIECKSEYNTLQPSRKFCGRKCFHKNYGKNHIGEKSHFWKGEKVGYFGIHLWLNKYFGRADCCENRNCLGLSDDFDWALIKGKKYERKRDNFWQLCVSCHKKYDMTDETRKKISIIKSQPRGKYKKKL